MPRTRPTLALVCLLAACGQAPQSAASGPREGTWEGDELSFVLEAGVVRDLKVHDASCEGDDGCKASYGGAIAGTWPVAGGLAVEADGYRILGDFTGVQMVSGSVVMGPEGACCRVIGAWTAEWVKPLPGAGGNDAGATDGGPTLGSPDWGGASVGDLHPGPSHSLPAPEGSAALADHQKKAHDALLEVRAAVGAGPIAQDALLAKAAQSHAEFFVTHAKQYQATGLNPHKQDASFGEGFTGTSFGDRIKAAGFSGPPGSEVMAFTGSPTGAIQGWMETVYHRLPLISPTSTLFGYGGAAAGGAKCEVIDFSARGPRADDPVVVYPWPGQGGVPRAWSGNEGPQPPPPPGGYPSGPVITARVTNATAWGSHSLTDAAGTEIPHVFLDRDNDPNMKSFDRHAIAMYANEPLAADTTYTVTVQVTVGGAERTLSWRFTTAP